MSEAELAALLDELHALRLPANECDLDALAAVLARRGQLIEELKLESVRSLSDALKRRMREVLSDMAERDRDCLGWLNHAVSEAQNALALSSNSRRAVVQYLKSGRT